MILRVVSTPTSEQQEFPQLSKTASSTLDFPATALLNLEKKVVLIFRDLYLKSLFFLMKIIFLKNSLLTVLGMKH
jgi:hypothetical protein